MFMLVIFKTLERSQPGEGVERTGDGRPGGRRKHIYVNLTSHHSDSLPFKLSWDPALIASPPSLQDHIHPHTPTHTTSSSSTRATPRTARGGITGPWQHRNKSRMGCVPDSLTQPSSTSGRDGGELARSRDPGCVVAAICLGVC